MTRRPEPLATHAADALLLVAGPALAAALAPLWHCGPFWTDARTVRARCRFVCVSVAGVRAHHGVYRGAWAELYASRYIHTRSSGTDCQGARLQVRVPADVDSAPPLSS